MFEITDYTIVQFVTLIVYAALIVIVLRYARARLKKLFLVFLVASLGWSLVSYMSNVGLPESGVSFWSRLVPLFAAWSVGAYAHFIAAYVRRGTSMVAKAAYGYILTLAVLAFLGQIPQGFNLLDNGVVQKDYGQWIILISGGCAVFWSTVVFLLVKSFRESRNPDYRNRITYLLLGQGILMVFGAMWGFAPYKLAIDHIGHLGNALVITYVLLRYKLLDFHVVVRKGMVYSAVTVSITALYLVMLSGLGYLLSNLTPFVGIAVTMAMVVLVAFIFNALRKTLQKWADRLFYGKKYDYRQMVLSFASRMSNVLEMGELAEAMLRPITNAVGASQASLLFASKGYFTAQFAERLVVGEPVIPIALRKNDPIVDWLMTEDKPLSRETIEIATVFKGLWQEQKNALDAAEIELLCPIKSKNRLIAILAMSKKHPRGFYSNDDTDLLMTLCHEAAVAIENAQMYAKAKERANTDELTGLFNHRYFHERLDEEIARCSRFGNIFSLIFMDMDNFKAYNDIYGHLAGDEILNQIGQHIKDSSRVTDIGYRYGGDEFAVILPETSLEDAHKVAERIRRGVEAQMDWKGIPLTCSIGISSWPTDGVMRAEIIRAADAALYHAKQTGGNRICWACEVVLSEALRVETTMEPQSKKAILNTIYALAATVDAKDHHTYGHSKKVSKYASDLAGALGYSQERVEIIRTAALLHDIGKLGLSDQLLSKRETLSPDDWELIRAHPNLGVSILRHVDSLRGCLAAVQYHHERYDGTGYPAGLSGNNIPMDARILAVADAFDAMTSKRPYRDRELTREEAFEELQRYAGTQFDPAVINAFLELGVPKLTLAPA